MTLLQKTEAPVWLESESEVAQSCPTLCNPMDCSLPGSSIHGIFQTRVLEWVPLPSPGDLPNPGIEPRSPALQVDALPESFFFSAAGRKEAGRHGKKPYLARNFRGPLETGGPADSQQKKETLSSAATRSQTLQTTTQEEKQVLPQSAFTDTASMPPVYMVITNSLRT